MKFHNWSRIEWLLLISQPWWPWRRKWWCQIGFDGAGHTLPLYSHRLVSMSYPSFLTLPASLNDFSAPAVRFWSLLETATWALSSYPVWVKVEKHAVSWSIGREGGATPNDKACMGWSHWAGGQEDCAKCVPGAAAVRSVETADNGPENWRL